MLTEKTPTYPLSTYDPIMPVVVALPSPFWKIDAG